MSQTHRMQPCKPDIPVNAPLIAITQSPFTRCYVERLHVSYLCTPQSATLSLYLKKRGRKNTLNVDPIPVMWAQITFRYCPFLQLEHYSPILFTEHLLNSIQQSTVGSTEFQRVHPKRYLVHVWHSSVHACNDNCVISL